MGVSGGGEYPLLLLLPFASSRMVFLLFLLVLLSGLDCQPQKRAAWENECCKEKIVGGKRYLNIGYDPTGMTMKFKCLSPCIFEKEGEEGSKYCFAAGDMRVECQGQRWQLPAR